MITCFYRDAREYELDDTAHVLQDFEEFYEKHKALLNESVWQQHYSRRFLLQPTTARFWRLPDVQDLPDSINPFNDARDAPPGHYLKLPHWAYNVMVTRERQPKLASDVIISIAKQTLRKAIERQRASDPNVQPYSETQVQYWLRFFGLDRPLKPLSEPELDFLYDYYQLTANIGREYTDVLKWNQEYSLERWYSSEASAKFLEPDREAADDFYLVQFHGYPDGGSGSYCESRGWLAEVGSEEEVEFLVAVAMKELEGVDNIHALDFTIRSHMLMGVLCMICELSPRELQNSKATLRRQVIAAGRLEGEDEAERWIEKVMKVMASYVTKPDEVSTEETLSWAGRLQILERILLKNGQLFARYYSFSTRAVPFSLSAGTSRKE